MVSTELVTLELTDNRSPDLDPRYGVVVRENAITGKSVSHYESSESLFWAGPREWPRAEAAISLADGAAVAYILQDAQSTTAIRLSQEPDGHDTVIHLDRKAPEKSYLMSQKSWPGYWKYLTSVDDPAASDASSDRIPG